MKINPSNINEILIFCYKLFEQLLSELTKIEYELSSSNLNDALKCKKIEQSLAEIDVKSKNYKIDIHEYYNWLIKNQYIENQTDNNKILFPSGPKNDNFFSAKRIRTATDFLEKNEKKLALILQLGIVASIVLSLVTFSFAPILICTGLVMAAGLVGVMLHIIFLSLKNADRESCVDNNSMVNDNSRQDANVKKENLEGFEIKEGLEEQKKIARQNFFGLLNLQSSVEEKIDDVRTAYGINNSASGRQDLSLQPIYKPL